MHMNLTPMQDPSLPLPRVGIPDFAVSTAFLSLDYFGDVGAG